MSCKTTVAFRSLPFDPDDATAATCIDPGAISTLSIDESAAISIGTVISSSVFAPATDGDNDFLLRVTIVVRPANDGFWLSASVTGVTKTVICFAELAAVAESAIAKSAVADLAGAGFFCLLVLMVTGVFGFLYCLSAETT